MTGFRESLEEDVISCIMAIGKKLFSLEPVENCDRKRIDSVDWYTLLRRLQSPSRSRAISLFSLKENDSHSGYARSPKNAGHLLSVIFSGCSSGSSFMIRRPESYHYREAAIQSSMTATMTSEGIIDICYTSATENKTPFQHHSTEFFFQN